MLIHVYNVQGDKNHRFFTQIRASRDERFNEEVIKRPNQTTRTIKLVLNQLVLKVKTKT